MKKACVYQCLETRKLTDTQSLISHFDYLVKSGHQIDKGKQHDFYSFGFDSLTADGVREEIVQYVEDVRALKKQKLLANNVNDIAFTDMITLPLDYTEQMVTELTAGLYMLDPSVPCCFVLHEKSNKGVNHPHLQMVRLKRTKDGLERMNEKMRLKIVQLTRQTISDTFTRHEYSLKEPTARQYKHVKNSKQVIRNFALHDAILAGEADIKAGISARVTSSDFLLKVATNQLNGQKVETTYIRAVAKEEAELRSLKEFNRTAKEDDPNKVATPRSKGMYWPSSKGMYWPTVKRTNEKPAEIDDPNHVVVMLMSKGMYGPRTVVANTSDVKTANVVTQQQVVKTANVVTHQVRVKQHGRREQMLEEMTARRAQRQNVPNIPPVGSQPLTHEQLQQVSPTSTLNSSIVPKTGA